MNTLRFAFYIGTDDNPGAKIGDRLICWVTEGEFSHAEFLVSVGFVPGVTFEGSPWNEPIATVVSSSIRDGGVRRKLITFDTHKWVVLEIDVTPMESQLVQEYLLKRLEDGISYGYLDLLSFIFPFRISTSSDFCSEIQMDALKHSGVAPDYIDSWHTHPQGLFDWLSVNRNARIIPSEALRLTWSVSGPMST